MIDALSISPRRNFLLLLATSLGLAGCSSSTPTVTGRVYYNEVLVKAGTVTFYCADGRGIPTAIHEDGSYTVDNVPVGKVKICVDTSSLDPNRRKGYSYAPPPGQKKEVPGSRAPNPNLFVAIPRKYADEATTELTYEVTGGRQSYDIKMK